MYYLSIYLSIYLSNCPEHIVIVCKEIAVQFSHKQTLKFAKIYSASLGKSQGCRSFPQIYFWTTNPLSSDFCKNISSSLPSLLLTKHNQN